MSVLTVGIVNGILAVTVVALLAFVCRIPYWIVRVARSTELPAATAARNQRELAHERFAA